MAQVGHDSVTEIINGIATFTFASSRLYTLPRIFCSFLCQERNPFLGREAAKGAGRSNEIRLNQYEKIMHRQRVNAI